jgi:hypothetical protein
MLTIFTLFALPTEAALTDPTPELVGNVTVENSDEFTFRLQSTSLLPLLSYNALYLSSLEVSGLMSLDGIFGSFYTCSNLFGAACSPGSYMTEFTSAASWSGALNPVTADVSAAASFVSTEYVSLEAFNNNGTSLGVTFLSELTWRVSSLNNNNDGQISYATFTGTRNEDDLTISIDVVTSTVLGQLNWGAVMTPRVLKTRINVTNYPDAGDTLVLNLVAASAAASANASVLIEYDDSVQLVRNTNDSADSGTYFDFALDVACDGRNKRATIDITAGALGELNGTNLFAQLTGQASAGASVEVYNVAVSIPSTGANEFVWDPSLGSGTPPEMNQNSSASTGVVIAVVVGVALAALGAFYCYRQSRAKPEALVSRADGTNNYQGSYFRHNAMFVS